MPNSSSERTCIQCLDLKPIDSFKLVRQHDKQGHWYYYRRRRCIPCEKERNYQYVRPNTCNRDLEIRRLTNRRAEYMRRSRYYKNMADEIQDKIDAVRLRRAKTT